MNNSILEQFLESQNVTDGMYEISSARGFQHDEGNYDHQYGIEELHTDQLQSEANHLLDICRGHGFLPGGTVLEIGSGTGRISIGLALQPDVGHLIITDPSPAFCRIVQRKLTSLEPRAALVSIGVLGAEDVRLLPPESVHLILLRSVLHHIADVDAFLSACARVLPVNGLLICEEPYYEGYMMMGLLGQFLPDALAVNGFECSEGDRERINNFVATMQYYCRRDVDKSLGEDKHLFRPDELMVSGRKLSLELTHYPNRRFTDSLDTTIRTRTGYFCRFFSDYVRYCMAWGPELVEKTAIATARYFQFFQPLETAENTTPSCFGTFVFTKR